MEQYTQNIVSRVSPPLCISLQAGIMLWRMCLHSTFSGIQVLEEISQVNLYLLTVQSLAEDHVRRSPDPEVPKTRTKIL